MGQNHPATGASEAQVDASNTELIVQKPDGPIQYYLQVGGYSIPTVGVPYVSMSHAVNTLYRPLPVAYLKLQPTESFSIMAGNLPTLFGAAYTLTYENMNIERSLQSNQEKSITRLLSPAAIRSTFKRHYSRSSTSSACSSSDPCSACPALVRACDIPLSSTPSH